MELRGKAVLITGGSRGLGRALGEELAGAGARLVLVARHARELEEAVSAIRSRGGIAHGVAADIASKDAIYGIAGEAAALIGPIDVLINNASELGPVPLRLLLDTDCEDFERVLAVNLVGPFRLAKAIMGQMVLRGNGLVVNITSDASVEAYSHWGAYGVSKAALDHLGRIWAAELNDTGVRVVTVDPGEMNTQMHADAMPEAEPALLTKPREVARRILGLITAEPSVANGARVAAMEAR